MKVIINHHIMEISGFPTLREAARQATGIVQNRPVAAFMNHVLVSLQEKVLPEAVIEYVDCYSELGMQICQQRAVLLILYMLKKMFPDKPAPLLSPYFILGSSLFIHLPECLRLVPDLTERLESGLQMWTAQDLPVIRNAAAMQSILPPEDLSANGMEDLHTVFRDVLPVCAEDIPCFFLKTFEDGLLLCPPADQKPDWIWEADDCTRHKLFQILRSSAAWKARTQSCSAGQLNAYAADDRGRKLIFLSEMWQNAQINTAAAAASRLNRKLILIAGPSSSGKTSFAYRLAARLETLELHSHILSMDNYFRSREDTPKNPDGTYNFDTPAALDTDRFQQDMKRLLKGQAVQLPQFSFYTGHAEDTGPVIQLGSRDLLLVEGIFAHCDSLTAGLPDTATYRIYVSAMDSICQDSLHWISPADIRLIRRIVRDAYFRGTSARETIASWASVRKGEEENIFPFLPRADTMINTTALYEPAVLGAFARPLLHQIRPEEPEYGQALRLLKLLDGFLPMDDSSIPTDSLIREFIGGSCYPV